MGLTAYFTMLNVNHLATKRAYTYSQDARFYRALPMNLQPFNNMLAVLILLHSDPAYIHTGSSQVLVPQRILRIDDATSHFRNYSRERMTSLVNMNLLNACGSCIAFQVI